MNFFAETVGLRLGHGVTISLARTLDQSTVEPVAKRSEVASRSLESSP